MQFPTRSAIEGLGLSPGRLNTPAIPSWVRCPRCRHTFRSSGIRYFGFLTAGQLHIAIAVGFIAMVSFAFLGGR
jgi:hypothetical protein